MLFRRHFPSASRALVFAAATVAALGVVDCTTFGSTVAGDLNGTLLADRPHASLSDVMNGATGTYIDRLLADRDSTFERWSDHMTAPLRVWIDSTSQLRGDQSEYPEAVRYAFAQWAETGIPLRFEYVARAGDADIRVKWTDHLDHKTGSTSWRTDRGGLMIASEITLATHVSSGSPLDARGMRAIALHEVGHALGLSHSSDAHDIMAPLVRVENLSATDRNTIRLLYNFPAGKVGT